MPEGEGHAGAEPARADDEDAISRVWFRPVLGVQHARKWLHESKLPEGWSIERHEVTGVKVTMVCEGAVREEAGLSLSTQVRALRSTLVTGLAAVVKVARDDLTRLQARDLDPDRDHLGNELMPKRHRVGDLP